MPHIHQKKTTHTHEDKFEGCVVWSHVTHAIAKVKTLAVNKSSINAKKERRQTIIRTHNSDSYNSDKIHGGLN